MKYFIALFVPAIFITACGKKTKVVSEKATTVITQPVNGFVCDYEKQKTVCLQFQQQPGTAALEKKITQTICDSMIPCWYGTPWNFYGTSETPGRGSIACGYFVTTLVRDAGIPIQRIKMAQCASEEMIRTVCKQSSIRKFSNTDIDKFINKVKAMGFGLYITGLDTHTGFIYNDGDEVYFIHSNYRRPYCVIKEIAKESAVLSSSKYRVIGK
jgi:hypothetical protein